MKEISYNKEFMQLLKKVSKLTKEFILNKENGNVVIRSASDKSIFVELITPESNFDFESESIGFVDGAYEKFYKFLDSYKNPKLKQDGDKLIVGEGNSNIKFRLSDPRIIKNSFKALKPFPPSPLTWEINKNHFTDISDMIDLVGAENVTFNISGKTAKISVINENTENSFNLELEMAEETKDVLEQPIKSTLFLYAPPLNYKVSVIKTAFQFESVNEYFTIRLLTGFKIK